MDCHVVEWVLGPILPSPWHFAEAALVLRHLLSGVQLGCLQGRRLDQLLWPQPSADEKAILKPLLDLSVGEYGPCAMWGAEMNWVPPDVLVRIVSGLAVAHHGRAATAPRLMRAYFLQS